jgi:EamA domain-containing membrane protein RarD
MEWIYLGEDFVGCPGPVDKVIKFRFLWYAVTIWPFYRILDRSTAITTVRLKTLASSHISLHLSISYSRLKVFRKSFISGANRSFFLNFMTLKVKTL